MITNINVYSCYDMLLNNNKDNINDEFDINMVNERVGMYKKRETNVNGFNDRTRRLVGQMRQVNKMGLSGIEAFKKTNKDRLNELIKGNVTLRENVRF
jgi:hypothetical protein